MVHKTDRGKIKDITDQFTTAEEIDAWYDSAIAGLARGAAAMVDKYGVEDFNHLAGAPYQLLVANLERIRTSMYRAVVGKDPTNHRASIEEVMYKHIKFY